MRERAVVNERAVIGKITRYLIPYLGIIYLIAYIDRQNVSYAKLQMVDALGLSEYAYGLGASLFFIGYFLFEVPSNIFLERFGAPRWFARIMLTWGAVTVALAYTQNTTMFYVLRFLLGVCEAGFFPGVLYLLTLWFPHEYRGRMVGSFMVFSAFANAIGAPIGGMLLDLDGYGGHQGWQWVFLVTGIPAMLMGIVTLFYLDGTPETSRILTPEEKRWLAERLANENNRLAKTSHVNPLKVLADGRVLLMSVFYIAFPLGAYGLSYWLPTIVKGFGVSNTVNGWINVIPWLMVALGLYYWPKLAVGARSSTPFIVGPALVGAACLILSVYVPSNTLRFAFLCIAAVAIFVPQPILWSIPSTFLSGASAAAGLAVINSVGNLGGFIAQNVIPWIRDASGSNTVPMLFLAACLAVGGLMTFVVQAVIRRHRVPGAAGTAGLTHPAQ
ncbi:MFS transporter [Roseomonas elaeocarpi]|uniref:MFS transporter n=1 Tax=Roseomonas elaeocarpi TaxID=907779 RepID=A0ABV6JVW3_9PROT